MSIMFFTVPLTVFMLFVAPIWLLLHYRSKRQANNGLSEEEAAQLQSLSKRADQLSGRVHTLEKILDAESPNWRSQYE